MSIYFFLIWLFFWMINSLINGMFKNVKEGFWGYHDRINDRIRECSMGRDEDEEESMIVKGLKKQRKEIEDIMGQYVFYRFCQRLSVYLTQIEVIVLFCLTIITVVFIHSAVLNDDMLWLTLWLCTYFVYLWREVSGELLKFEVWATHMFLKQYKVLSGASISSDIIESKKENKKVIRKLYLAVIVPAAVISYIAIHKYVIYPMMPEMDVMLQKNIMFMWLVFVVIGGGFAALVPVFLDKVLNARFKYSLSQIKESYYSITVYMFISLFISVVIEVAQYMI